MRRPQWKYTREVRKPSGCKAIRSAALTAARFSGRVRRKTARNAAGNAVTPLTATLRVRARQTAPRGNYLHMLRKGQGVRACAQRALTLTTGGNKSR